jgi:hypothetical protein
VNRDRKPILLRLDPAVHDALARWASDEFRSLNAQIEVLLRRALTDAGRMPKHAAPLPRRGRPLAADRQHSGEQVDSHEVDDHSSSDDTRSRGTGRVHGGAGGPAKE